MNAQNLWSDASRESAVFLNQCLRISVQQPAQRNVTTGRHHFGYYKKETEMGQQNAKIILPYKSHLLYCRRQKKKTSKNNRTKDSRVTLRIENDWSKSKGPNLVQWLSCCLICHLTQRRLSFLPVVRSSGSVITHRGPCTSLLPFHGMSASFIVLLWPAYLSLIFCTSFLSSSLNPVIVWYVLLVY